MPGSFRIRKEERKDKVVSLCKPREMVTATDCNAISQYAKRKANFEEAR